MNVISSHQIITPTCRANRGVYGALSEALNRISADYAAYAEHHANTGVEWHIKLERVEPVAVEQAKP